MHTLPQELSARFPGLKEMPDLEELIRYDNPDTYALDEQGQVIGLNLRSKKLTDEKAAFIWNLTYLKALNLSENELTSVTIPAEMKALRFLNVSSTAGLKKLTFAGRLPDLQEANLRECTLETLTIPPGMDALQVLDLEKNQLRAIVFEGDCPNLVHLYASNNRIERIVLPEGFGRLVDIYLNDNQLSSLRFQSSPPVLNTLSLRNNHIQEFSFPPGFDSLETLYLEKNQISDIGFLANLDKLKNLDLRENQITDLSPLLPLIKKDVQVRWESRCDIAVKDNPLVNPPVEIVKEGNDAILEFFRQKEAVGAEPLLEGKLILLGDGRAGKTSLANRLLGKSMPAEADRTRGVDIIIGEYTFPVAGNREFKLHIWDFAGQDTYKPLHQFFYTEDALYVMVADSGNANTDFDDWFQTAELFGGGSPLIMVLNEFSEGIGTGVFDFDHWQKRFPKLLQKSFLVSLLSKKGLGDVEQHIQKNAELLSHAQMEYPKNWAAIRRELEDRRHENYISLERYCEICRENQLPEKDSALILSGVLHKIGVCLHYQKSELLRQYVILKNEWATEAVYRILEDRIVAEEKKGFFDMEDLKRILKEDAFCDMRPQLLELMQQFKMAYPLPNKPEYVTPPLLPPAPPESWKMPSGTGLMLYIEYEFLPKALLTQFIVTRHFDIKNGRTLVWRNGVVLEWPDALAEVVKTKSQGRDAFSVHVQGSNSKGLLTLIIKTFRDLHQEYKGIKVKEIIPCPCAGCRSGANEQHYFEYENLKNRLEKGRSEVECDKSLEVLNLVKVLGNHFVFSSLSVGKPVELGVSGMTNQLNDPIMHGIEQEIEGLKKIFFSYSKHDREYLDQLLRHLSGLRREGRIKPWDDSHILPGEEWDDKVKQELAAADIILLLVSADFLATDYIWEVEIKEAMERHEQGTATVIPVIIRSCSWNKLVFGKLNGLPAKGLPVSIFKDRDEAWLEVVKGIERVL